MEFILIILSHHTQTHTRTHTYFVLFSTPFFAELSIMAILSANGYTLNLIRLTLWKDGVTIYAKIDMSISTPAGGNVDEIWASLQSGIGYTITNPQFHPVAIPESASNVNVSIQGTVSSHIETQVIEALTGDIHLRRNGAAYFVADNLAFGEIINNIAGSTPVEPDPTPSITDTADNLGGLLEMKVASTRHIQEIPDPVNGVVYGDVTFKEGYGWETWRVRPFDTGLTVKSKTSQEGAFREYALPFRIPKDRPAMANRLREAESDLFIILIRDANLQYKLVGTLDAPLQFKFDLDTGNSQRDLNHYSCEFFAEMEDIAAFYQGAIPSAPSGTLPVLIKRGDGVVLAALQPGEEFIITSGFSFGFRIVNNG